MVSASSQQAIKGFARGCMDMPIHDKADMVRPPLLATCHLTSFDDPHKYPYRPLSWLTAAAWQEYEYMCKQLNC